MKKSMESAYTDMMNNLAKSTAAVPLHLQGAAGALAWWEQPDSLLAKSEIAPAEELAKSSHENETDEAYEEDEKHDAEKEESEDEDEKEEGEEEESDEDPEPAEEGMKKSMYGNVAMAAAAAPLAISTLVGGAVMARDAFKNRGAKKKRMALEGKGKTSNPMMTMDNTAASADVTKALSELNTIASDMLKAKKAPERVGDQFLPGQMEMFGDAPPPARASNTRKPKGSEVPMPDATSKKPGTPMAKSAAAEASAHVEKAWQLYRDNH